MLARTLRCLLCSLIFAGTALAQGMAEQRITIDGTEVFYGIVPAEIVRAQQGKDARGLGWAERLRKRRHQKHVVVALYDMQSGQRILDASITATVTPLGLGGKRKKLEPIRIGEVTSYGNYFDFPPSSAPYKVELQIARANHPARTVSFDYSP